jgi:hypothetical protein
MEALLKVGSNVTVKVEGRYPTDLFKGISKVQEVFDVQECGCCKNKNLRFVVREVDGNEYYEMHCTDLGCRARLPFGLSKENKGEMYPKKRFASLSPAEQKNRESEKEYADGHSGYLANNGWYKYKKVEA